MSKRPRISLKKLREMRGSTNWERLSRLTEEEIKRAVALDPDAVIPTEAELAEFKRVDPKASDEDEDEQ